MTREAEPCAEPGCADLAVRGAYCAEHGALYYQQPHKVNVSPYVDDGFPFANLPGDMDQECSAVGIYLRQKRAARAA